MQQLIYKASSIGEPIIYTSKQATNKRKQSSSGGIIIGFCKEKIQIGVENELHYS